MNNKDEKFWNRLAKNYDHPDKIQEVSQYKSVEIINKYIKKYKSKGLRLEISA